jgi:hypothetical protein
MFDNWCLLYKHFLCRRGRGRPRCTLDVIAVDCKYIAFTIETCGPFILRMLYLKILEHKICKYYFFPHTMLRQL